LSDLLLAHDDWPTSIRDQADRRNRYFAVERPFDLWRNILDMRCGEEADRLREGNKRVPRQIRRSEGSRSC
jgi:hypothetical protein